MQAKKTHRRSRRNRKHRDKEIMLSKTREMGQAIDSEHISEMTEEEMEELKDCRSQMTDLTNRWYEAIRVSPNEESEDNENEITPISPTVASERG
ncbi:hypothetical protein B566_EDAN007352 [Ephemera danica]|nr:hypothetical protein B566_EDAN007352 [Ephemera danica]